MFKAIFATVIAVLAAASAHAQTRLPTRGGQETFPAVATVSFDVNGQTNCVVLLTGPCVLSRGNSTGPKTNLVIDAEIVSLSLTGSLPGVGPVTLRAGSNLVGRVSSGQIVSTNSFFPASSFFDVYASIDLPGGTSLVNTAAQRIEATITKTPALSQTYTNVGAASLFDSTDTNTVVGTLIQFGLTPANRGSQRQLGMSVNIAGTNDIGALTMGLCAGTQDVALASMQGQLFAGPMTPNAGCDEALGTNLIFATKWNTNVRAPDWRGYHAGRFIMFRVGSNGKTNLFAFGNLDGSNGAGTHRAPLAAEAEDCSSCGHFEGSLRGVIIESGTLSSGTIKGTYAGEHLDGSGNPISCCPPPLTPPHGAFRMTLDGVITTPCR